MDEPIVGQITIGGHTATAPEGENDNPLLAELCKLQREAGDAQDRYTSTLAALERAAIGQDVYCTITSGNSRESTSIGRLCLQTAAKGTSIILDFTILGVTVDSIVFVADMKITFRTIRSLNPQEPGDELPELADKLHAAETARRTFITAISALEAFYKRLVGQFVRLTKWQDNHSHRLHTYPDLWGYVTQVKCEVMGDHPIPQLSALTVTVIAPTWEPQKWNRTGQGVRVYNHPSLGARWVPVVVQLDAD